MKEVWLFWISSTIVSIWSDFDLFLCYIKELALKGYKINIDRIDSLPSCNTDVDVNEFLEKFFPLYNLGFTYLRRLEFYEQVNYMTYALMIMGIVEKMTQEEQKEYLKNPTLFNALFLTDRIDNIRRKSDKYRKIILEINKLIDNSKRRKTQIEALVFDEVVYSQCSDKEKKELKKELNNIIKTIKKREKLIQKFSKFVIVEDEDNFKLDRKL